MPSTKQETHTTRRRTTNGRSQEQRDRETVAELEKRMHDVAPGQHDDPNREADLILRAPAMGIERFSATARNPHVGFSTRTGWLGMFRMDFSTVLGVEELTYEMTAKTRPTTFLRANLERIREAVVHAVAVVDRHPEIVDRMTPEVGRGAETTTTRIHGLGGTEIHTPVAQTRTTSPAE